MAELVRVYHGMPTLDAQVLVNRLVERRLPLIWEVEGKRRVLDPTMKLKPQVLVLLATSAGKVSTADLINWIEYENKNYFLKLLRQMHAERLVELSANDVFIEILPPGSAEAAKAVRAAA